MLRRGALALVSWLALACGGPPVDTPSAVILFSPDTICQGDAHRTTVQLDGTMSSRHLALVPLPPEDTAYPDGATTVPLAFAWRLEGDAFTIESGSLTSSTLAITAAGDRPLHVTLTTTNLAGGTATTLRTLPITVPARAWATRFCTGDGDCAAGDTCDTSAHVCGMSPHCMADTACAGGSCDPTTHTCVPATTCSSDAQCPPCFVCNTLIGGCMPRPT